MTICNQVDNPISMSGFVIKPKHKFDSIIVDLAPRRIRFPTIERSSLETGCILTVSRY